MLDAMLQSGHGQTPVLIVNAKQSESDVHIHNPILVADELNLCTLANHPWQVLI